MADHVNRSAGWEGVNEAYGELLDDPKWRVRYDALPENLPQQERILFLLKQRLKELRAATFMPDFEIMNSGRRAREDAARPRHPQVAWR